MMNNFDLNLLRVLGAMMDEGSTTLAAEKLGLTQSAVSAALGRLRHRLDDPLFVREGQRLVPTPFCRSIEAPLKAALAQISVIAGGPAVFDPAIDQAVFRISGSDYFGEALMPELVRRIARGAPGVRVHMIDTIFQSTLDSMERFDVDLAFWPKLDFPSWIDFEELVSDNFVICAAKGHPQLASAGIKDGDPIPLDLFCALDHVSYVPDGTPRHQGDAILIKTGRQRRLVATMPSFRGVYNLIARSEIIGGLPSRFVEKILAEGLVTSHPAPVSLDGNRLCMYWHKQRTSSQPHIWLRSQVRDIIHGFAAETDHGTQT